MKYYVHIDWGRDSHIAYILNEMRYSIKSFEVANTAQGVRFLIAELGRFQAKYGPLFIERDSQNKIFDTCPDSN